MTTEQAITELQFCIGQCESQILYYEENAPGWNTGAISVYKKALEMAVESLMEREKRMKRENSRVEKECWNCGAIVDSEHRCCPECGIWL